MPERRHNRGILTIGREFLSRFRPEIRAQRMLLTGAFTALIGQTLLRLIEPWPLGIVIDHVLGGASAKNGSGTLFAQYESADLLAAAAFTVLAVALLRAWTGYVGTVGFALVGNRVLTTARARLFRHLQSLSLAFHKRSRSGDVVIRVIGDVGTVRDVTVTALLPLLAQLAADVDRAVDGASLLVFDGEAGSANPGCFAQAAPSGRSAGEYGFGVACRNRDGSVAFSW